MRNLKFLCVGGWLAIWLGLVGAQNYPAQPIKLIQPFAPGAASEVALRIVAERLSVALKTTVLIENRPWAPIQWPRPLLTATPCWPVTTHRLHPAP